jgi:hypothetical protein
MIGRTTILAVAVMVLVGCTGGSEKRASPPGLSGTCGLPSPDPDSRRDDSLVPDYFLPEGAEIAKAQAERGGFITAINVPLSVGGAFEHYRTAARDAGYEVIQTDNEGFEAEIYLRRGKKVAAIQVRTSTCDDRSIVFVNEIVPE